MIRLFDRLNFRIFAVLFENLLAEPHVIRSQLHVFEETNFILNLTLAVEIEKIPKDKIIKLKLGKRMILKK